MIRRHDTAGPLDAVRLAQKRDDMASSGLVDRGMKACERADVNHDAYVGRWAAN
jgi:hypothetical protein